MFKRIARKFTLCDGIKLGALTGFFAAVSGGWAVPIALTYFAGQCITKHKSCDTQDIAEAISEFPKDMQESLVRLALSPPEGQPPEGSAVKQTD